MITPTEIPILPRVGIILGSGFASVTDTMTLETLRSFSNIPGLAAPTTPGHRGELAIGLLAGHAVAVLRGRLHFYEGYDMQQITAGVRLLHALGCHTLVVTCAAGGLHADWSVGDIMLLTDHIFLPGMAGHHPLRDVANAHGTPCFLPMLDAYDPALQDCAHHAAERHGVVLREGVYAMVSGPTFETAAELRLLRRWGADAVGMSTIPEVIVARHLAMRVLGLALITNLALPDGSAANHQDVLAAGINATARCAALLQTIISQMSPQR